MNYRSLLPVAATFIVTILLTGCGTNNASPPAPSATAQKTFLNPEQMPEAVTAEIKAFPLPLPTDAAWFTETPEQLKKSGTKYEDGVARGVVTFYWLCSWEREYIAAFNRSDSADEKSALEMIGKFPTTPFYTASVQDPNHGWEHTVLDPAKLGDPKGMKQYYTQSCSQFKLGDPTTPTPTP